jgi:hypothetical protein
MIKLDKDKWVSVIDCHFCKKQTPTKEAISTPVDSEYFIMYVAMCKECSRESKLNNLFKSEKQE